MKKLGMAFIMALLALAFVAVPVLADGGNASVTCDPITVTDDSPAVGTTITFYGNVTIVANATADTDYSRSWAGWTGWYFTEKTDRWTVADATSTAWYEIRDPNGDLVASGSNTESDHKEGALNIFWVSTGYGTGYWSSSCTEDVTADAGQPFPWHADVLVEMAGEYTATQGGTVTVYYGNYSRTATWVSTGCCGGYWDWADPVLNKTPLTAEGECPGKTVIAHANAPLATGRTRPILTILTSEDSEVYFPSEGWGDPTTADIVYNDGTWQVEIADGTKILLDGEWHRHTWIEVDDQGNVIGRYGYDGHIIAEEIALSSPITITKVG